MFNYTPETAMSAPVWVVAMTELLLAAEPPEDASSG